MYDKSKIREEFYFRFQRSQALFHRFQIASLRHPTKAQYQSRDDESDWPQLLFLMKHPKD